MIWFLCIASLLLSALPAAMFLANLPLFCSINELSETAGDPTTSGQDAKFQAAESLPQVSVLIPARDEAAGIADCIASSLDSEGVTAEVIVLDDHSSDETASIVQSIASNDDRVKLVSGRDLASGWNGKQHACKQLAEAAAFDCFVFLDADVRLRPDGLRRLIDYRTRSHVDLLSAFPHQVTDTWLESWLIPMMHFVLLGFLPFARMRSNGDPSLAAGCGQLFLTTRNAYAQAGTHEAIKSSRHDGIKLPRAYRSAGLLTDVVDGTALASCRMYDGARETIRGALKNATEGIANPRLIVLFTVLLLGVSVLPLLAVAVSVVQSNLPGMTIASLALVLAHLPRMMAAAKFRQSWVAAFCHIPATTTFLVLQWIALGNHLLGRQVTWRGRTG